MNIENFNVKENQVATVLTEETFYIGKNKNIEVTVNLYKNNGKYYITSWLNGCEECNTSEYVSGVKYTGSTSDRAELLAAMQKLVDDNERYILDLADWDGN